MSPVPAGHGYREYSDPTKAEVYRTETGWTVWCGPCGGYYDEKWHAGGKWSETVTTAETGSYILCAPYDGALGDSLRRFLVAHDPASVLRRCAADRKMVQAWLDSTKNPYEDATDDELHYRRGHSCYLYTLTEGQRKRWDDADTPPRGADGEPEDGWELNITERDPDAFERFDYHEERYWRRRVKDGPHVWTRFVPTHIALLARGYGLEAA